MYKNLQNELKLDYFEHMIRNVEICCTIFYELMKKGQTYKTAVNSKCISRSLKSQNCFRVSRIPSSFTVKQRPSLASSVTVLLTSAVPAERTGQHSLNFSPALISVSQQRQGHSAEKWQRSL